MLEKEIEQYFCKRVLACRGLVIKLCDPHFAGLPDRLVLLPDGVIFFVEFKSPGKKPRPLQVRVHKRLKGLGYKVYVVDGKEGCEEVLNDIAK